MDKEQIEYDFSDFAEDSIPYSWSEMDGFLENYNECDQEEVHRIVTSVSFSVIPTKRLEELIESEDRLKSLEK